MAGEPIYGPIPDQPRILFMGTPDFALPSFHALVRNGYTVEAVVTQPDRPKGRGKKTAPPPVKKAASACGIRVLQPRRVREPVFLDALRDIQPDIIVLVAYGQLLHKGLLDLPEWGVLNIHASLLPAYRGPAPIQWTIINREKKTGLTLMKMDEGMDTGPILFQEAVELLEHETGGSLHDRLAEKSGPFILKCLEALGKEGVPEIQQDHDRAGYAPKIDRDLARINWEEEAAGTSALIRAMDPWPGAVTLYKGKPFKLFSSRVRKEAVSTEDHGRIFKTAEALYIGASGGMVEIREIQAPGKRRMPVSDFIRGFPIQEGERFGP
jgi:methionyl-tRNA formyltransferase